DARTADSLAAMRQFGIADMVERQFRGQLGGLAARSGGGVQ
ncbi:MAG: peptidoglycan hydrolase, partial [Sphingopyxis sp.]|nr:peptidoglycan hydrolase [Sphingopyxis sp.]